MAEAEAQKSLLTKALDRAARALDPSRAERETSSRNPRHFDTIEGRGKSVSDGRTT